MSTITQLNLSTIANKVLLANSFIQELTSNAHNTYVGVGKIINPELNWANNLIPQPVETIDQFNDVFRNLIAIKKIKGSDACRVIPRVDWTYGFVYAQFDSITQFFSYESSSAISGKVSVTGGTRTLTGDANTSFTSELSPGSFISMYGDGINSGYVIKEVVLILNDSTLNVNSAISDTYTDNTAYTVIDTYPKYAFPFYVRNNLDQVFKCLYNNFNSQSAYMPEISLSGNLPEDPFIETPDGYKWKYMYTIPAGLKEKFFTQDWMPVIQENVVKNAAVNGALDIIELISGGSGYLTQGPLQGNSANADIVVVKGDGSGAVFKANVVNGVIQTIDTVNPGSGYTNVSISFVDSTQDVNGTMAVARALVGPYGGHGYDVYTELGATSVIVCPQLEGDENGTIPTITSSGESLYYGQISIIQDPESSNTGLLSNSNYTTASVISTTPPNGSYNFHLGETVYAGTTLDSSSFSGTVVNWVGRNSSNPTLWINNMNGTFVSPNVITGVISSNGSVLGLSFTPSDYKPYSGKILYIENRSAIIRDPAQTEQLKLTLSF